MPGKTDTNSTPADTSRFATTHWSLVLAAGSPKSTRYHEALETLCRTYWFPLYAYLRRQGYDSHQAEDHVQAFLAGLLEKQGLRLVDPQLGRFRSYLLGALKHFLADERDRERTQKRGGGKSFLSFDFASGETQYELDPVDKLSPEKLFEKSWALTVLQRTMQRLEDESANMQGNEVFQDLVTYLAPAGDTVPYRDMGTRLNMTEGAVKAAVYRLRKRYREMLQNEISETVSSEEQIQEELRDLFTALSF
jgi:RNA polymerase sigma factor (sigma-70 family)